MKNAVIHWKLDDNGKVIEGHGSPMRTSDAVAWVRMLNEQFGPGTHWVVEEEEEVDMTQFVHDWDLA